MERDGHYPTRQSHVAMCHSRIVFLGLGKFSKSSLNVTAAKNNQQASENYAKLL